MKFFSILHRFRSLFLTCAVGLAFFVIPKTVSAQGADLVSENCFTAEFPCDTEGVSAILSSTNGQEIDTYVETTFIDFSSLEGFDPFTSGFLSDDPSDPGSYGYFAAVEGDLYENNTPKDSVFNEDDFGLGYTEAYMTDAVTPGSNYVLIGTHGVVDIYGDAYALGQTGVSVYAGPPHIVSFSPTYGYVGTSGQITVQGQGLYDPFTLSINASFGSGTGSTITPQSVTADGTQLTLAYTIASNASTGPVNIVLSDRFGTSTSTQTFDVGDPAPIISSVVPSVWQAGTTNLPITITGSGFGSNPTVTISAPGVTLNSVNSTSDTNISAAVSIASNTPNETAVVTVQSNGENGSSFVAALPAESPTASYNATVAAIPAPVPQIYLYGQPISINPSQPTSVIAGQLMALSATVVGKTLQSQTWQISKLSAAVGGYTNAAGTGIPDLTGGCLRLIQGQTQTQGSCISTASMPVITTNTTINFYWVASGIQTVTYSYSATDGMQNSATATFNVVSGPTGVTAGGNIGAVHPFNPGFMQLVSTNNNFSPPGVTFQVSANPPSGNSGTYQWVQLINFDHERYTDPGGRWSCVPVTFSNDPHNPALPELDTRYPYSAGQTTTNDSPSTYFSNIWGEVAHSFSVTMFSMWTPNPSGDCNDGTSQGQPCTIPIPLGTIAWQYEADAVNTLGLNPLGPIWSVQVQSESPNPLAFTSGSSFPTWQFAEVPNPLTNNVPFSCSSLTN